MENVVRNSTAKDADSEKVIIAKVVAMIVLGLGSFLIGILPIKLTKMISIKKADGEKNFLISLLLCFGGGVLLYTTFLHLLPEVNESFTNMVNKNTIPELRNGIPWGELVFCMGFFFVYLIEELVHMFLDRKLNNVALHRSLSVRRCSKKDVSIPRVTLGKFDDGNISCISNSNKELLNSQTTVNFEKHSHDHNHHHIDESIKNSLGGFLAVLALSFHAIFEGLAVGLEGSVEKVWYLFAAIATHKFVIAFCVGVELVTSKTKTLLVFLYIGTFAVVTPLGIGLGLFLSEKNPASENIVSVVLQGMAAGTLLYVVFFEVLARERNNQHSGIWQLLAIMAGFFCMFSLQMIIGHDHHHGAEDHHHHHHHHDQDHEHLIVRNV